MSGSKQPNAPAASVRALPKALAWMPPIPWECCSARMADSNRPNRARCARCHAEVSMGITALSLEDMLATVSSPSGIVRARACDACN